MRIFKDFSIQQEMVKEMYNVPTFTYKEHDYTAVMSKPLDEVEFRPNTSLIINEINDLTLTLKSTDGVIEQIVSLNNANFDIKILINDKEVLDEDLVKRSLALFNYYYFAVVSESKSNKEFIEAIFSDYID